VHQTQDGQRRTQDAAQSQVRQVHPFHPGTCASDASDDELPVLLEDVSPDHPELLRDRQNPDNQDADAGRLAYAALPEVEWAQNT
jgi:hypothetical protein